MPAQISISATGCTKWRHGCALEIIRSDRKSDLSIDTYSTDELNIPAQFHLDPIWNDGALGFFGSGRPNKNQNNKKKKQKNKLSSNVGSGTDPVGSGTWSKQKHSA